MQTFELTVQEILDKQFIGDAVVIAAKMQKVANQGKKLNNR